MSDRELTRLRVMIDLASMLVVPVPAWTTQRAGVGERFI
jgi:hypothetical protein